MGNVFIIELDIIRMQFILHRIMKRIRRLRTGGGYATHFEGNAKGNLGLRLKT